MQTEGEEDIFGLSGGHRFPCNMNISQTPAFTSLILEGAAEEDAQRGKDFNASNEKGAEKKHSVMFFKMFSFADYKDVFLMTVGAVAAAANGLMAPLMTLLAGEMIQSFGGSIDTNNLVHEVSKVALKLVYLAVGAASASFLQVACWMATGERQAAQIRNLYLRTILRQEIAFFDADTSTGEVIGRISGDTVLIQDAMGEKVGQFIQLTTTFLGGFIIAFTRGWLLSLVMLSMFPLIVLAGGAMVTVVSKMALVGQKAYAEAAAIVEESVSSIRTVASFTGEKVSVKKYKKSLESAYRSSVHEGFAVGLGVGAVTLIMFCGYSWGTWFGSELILHKGYTGGRVMSVIFSLVTGSFALGQASPCITAFAAGQAAFYKMFEMINRKPLINAYETTGLKLNDISGDIEFRDVDFSYPSRPSEQIFRGFSLHVHTGTTVALVGESGSGKSTVISLIERFYDPQAGKVLIDGVNLKELQLRWIRGKIGLVSQEPVLFASSIRNNIAYGKDGATIAEIAAAAELANASKFIDKLPQGLDTVIGERGKQLSGGQKQRIAIARAILKDPRILLLDEATSALDLESEGVVQEALDRVLKNRTTVIVAHRLSTVRNAHTIAVLSRGSIVEKGSHSDLLKDPNGAYCQLLRLQEDKKDAYDQVSDCRQDKSGMPLGSELKTSLLSLVGVEVQESRPNELVAKMAIQEHKQVSGSRLVYLNKPEIPWLILGTIAAAANGLLFPIFGVLMSSAINTFYQPPPKLQTDSRHWCLLFLMFGLVGFLAAPAKSYFFALSGSKLIKRIRLMTFEKVMNMEMTWFDDPENSSGAIGARLAADAATVRSLVGDALALLVQNITTTAAGLIIAFAANWQLSLVISGLIPLLALNGWVQLKFMQGFSADAKMAYEEASQVASEAVGNIRTIASFSAEDKVMELYKKKCEGPMSRGIKQGVISGVGFGASFFLLFCVYAICFYAGARLIQDGKTTFEEVFRVFFALAMAAIGISHSSTLAPDSSKAQAATASIFAILDRSSKIDSSNDSGLVLKELQGDIEFHHVTFKYPTRPDVQIFNDLCLTIKSGQTVALVGESGCGKSTAIALLQRFYDPDSGQISIDGIEIKKFQLRWLRRQMGLVSQEPVLFNGTIRANIAYGKEGNASETEVLSAATSANAHQFISGLQQGYDTFVGEGGMQLSGGQKQRVAIARAMIKEPAILLLDEATSALDSESERVVQEALDRVRVNRTTVMIAHRLSTIRSADTIAVVKNGVIVEKGKHDTLININGGAYASLVTLHSRPS